MDTSTYLDTFLAQPQLSGLALSPDGRRLVVGAATPAPDGSRYRSALWAVDPAGHAPARQLTRSAAGESAARFAPDGSLLFTSARPDPDAVDTPDDAPSALWQLPAEGGEPRLLAAPDAGVGGVLVARVSGTVVIAAEVFAGSDDLDADAARRTARSDAGVTAMLLEGYPVRHWDRWLGPREPGRWLLSDPRATSVPDAGDTSAADAGRTSEAAGGPTSATDATLIARGPSLHEVDGELSPDGRLLVTGWRRSGPRREPTDLATDLVSIDLDTGVRRVLAADGRDHTSPVVSPDGRHVVAVATDLGAPDRAARDRLVVLDLDGPPGSGPDAFGTRDVAVDLDLWPIAPVWLPDGRSVVFTADDHGHRPVFRVDVDTDEVTRLTASGAYTDVCVAPDGSAVYALHAEVGTPPRPVRLDPTIAGQDPTVLPSPAAAPPDHSRVERLTTTADDGVEIASWLVLPADADGPVPLVVFLHGGPLGSWNTWHSRWNPHVLAAAGYAVLLPDPALSTGYGQAFVQRGWGRWGEAPFHDVMAAVEAAGAHPAIDADRLAAAGGSFGGYLANWIAGHTDRFRGIVTHASLWSLPGFHGTTDIGLFWEREFGDPYLDATRYLDNSPDRHVGSITTPMLVIHGEKDLRVPISEAQMLVTDLVRNGVDARLLLFPDENHWILRPQHARLWCATVLAFLAEQMRGEPFIRPELL